MFKTSTLINVAVLKNFSERWKTGIIPVQLPVRSLPLFADCTLITQVIATREKPLFKLHTPTSLAVLEVASDTNGNHPVHIQTYRPPTCSNLFNATVITNTPEPSFVKPACRTVGCFAQRTLLNLILWGLVGKQRGTERTSVFNRSSRPASIKQKSGSLIIHIVGSSGSGLCRAIFALTSWSNFHNSIWRRFACRGLNARAELPLVPLSAQCTFKSLTLTASWYNCSVFVCRVYLSAKFFQRTVVLFRVKIHVRKESISKKKSEKLEMHSMRRFMSEWILWMIYT